MKSSRASASSPRRAWHALAVAALLTGCAQPAPPSAERDFVYDGQDHSWSSAGTALKPLSLTAGDNDLSGEAWTSATSGWGPIERDRSNGEKLGDDGSPLSIGGVAYARGLGVHSNSAVAFDLAGQCQAFTASVGVDDEVGNRGSVVFEVYADGAKLWESGVMRGADPARTLRVDVAGRRELRLVVTDAGNGLSYDHADWAAARLLNCAPATSAPGQGQEIDLSPAEAIFSGVVSRVGAPQTVTLRNTGTSPLRVTDLALTGDHAASFRLVDPPALPLTLAPGESVGVRAAFAPVGVGSLQATLRVTSDDADEPTLDVNLYGLSARGEQGNLEPPLQQVVRTLGYSIDVGGGNLILGTGPAPIGDEVAAPLFVRAGPGPVTLRPVARYSPDDLLPFGYYTPLAGGAEPHQVGVIALGGEQSLNPPVVPGGQEAFELGDAPFGLYVGATSYAPQNSYTQDGLNTARVKHAARVYPLKDRAGQPVADSYLVAFEPAVNGDYQDYVFVASNLKPAPAPTPAPPPAPPTVNLPGWTPLFNGRDLGGWSTWLPSQGTNRDPQGVFKVQDGKLHVLDLPVTGQNQEFGYVATTVPYADYRLRLRYQWGTKKFAPRADAPRDAGLVYGVSGPDRLWPVSAEFQIQEHDTGDLWLIGGTNATVRVADPAADPGRYQALGTPHTTSNAPGAYGRVVKGADAERPTGWNDLELVVSGDEATHIVNGQVVNQLSALRAPNGAPLTSGRILLQAEGAEVWYGDVEVRPLAYTPPPAGATVLFGGQDRSAWQMRRGGGEINWPVEAGALVVNPSGSFQNDIRSAATYTDFRLHLEFKVPATDPGLGEQARGNSGVYLQGRYELQILDSFGKTLQDKNDLGALYGVRDASTNAALPAGVWQSYDVIFRAARWSGGAKNADATVTAWLNGDLVQDNVQLPDRTLLGDPEADTPGPILLQDHGHRVQFRNIWVQPL